MANSPPTECGNPVANLIKKLHVTSPLTPEVISTVLDDVLRDQGPFDFGRGFDIKSALTEIIKKVLATLAADTKYQEAEMVTYVLLFFQVMMPSIASMNELAARISECPKISEPNELDLGQQSLFSYVLDRDERAFQELSVAWKRYEAFQSNIGLDNEMKFAIAELLALDVRKAATVCPAEITNPDISQYLALGVPYSELEKECEWFHTSFRLLRQDLDGLCPESFDRFLDTTIKASLKAVGAENKDQGYWRGRQWAMMDPTSPKDTSQSELNVLFGLENLVSKDGCMKFWKRKRLAIYKEMSTYFDDLVLVRAYRTETLSITLGTGMALFASMRSMGQPFDSGNLSADEFDLLCQAFADHIPELGMINDKITASIVIPGLDLGNSKNQANSTSKPKTLKEGMEDVRDFYERLLKGKLISTDLTTPYVQLLYLDIEHAKAVFDQRLIEEGNVSNAAAPNELPALRGSQQTALSPLSNPRKRIRASTSEFESDEAQSESRKKRSRVNTEP